jgi:hypothetical protein
MFTETDTSVKMFRERVDTGEGCGIVALLRS